MSMDTILAGIYIKAQVNSAINLFTNKYIDDKVINIGTFE